MDVADYFPIQFSVNEMVAYRSIGEFGVRIVKLEAPVVIHNFSVVFISFIVYVDKYIPLIYLFAVAVEKPGELTDAVRLHPRLGFAIADGEQTVAVVDKRAIDPMSVSSCLGAKFDYSTHCLE